MSGKVVIGSQFGDEGKGKITDFLAESADIVVRYQGGNNAGHTIVIDNKTYILFNSEFSDITIQIFDHLGRKIFEQEINHTKKGQQVEIHINRKVKNGFYILKIFNNDFSMKKSLIKI